MKTLFLITAIVALLFGIGFEVLLYYAMKSSDLKFIKGASRTLYTYWLLGAIFLVMAQLNVQLDMIFGCITVG